MVQAEDSTDIGPCDECFDSTSKPRPFQVPGPYQGRNTYRVIPRLRTEVGVEEPVLDQLIDWCAATWPLGDWDAIRVP